MLKQREAQKTVGKGGALGHSFKFKRNVLLMNIFLLKAPLKNVINERIKEEENQNFTQFCSQS